MEPDQKKIGGKLTPSANNSLSLRDGYNQTYIILKKDINQLSNDHDNTNDTPSASSSSISNEDKSHDVFFRCGNWCYRGSVEFHGTDINVKSLPTIIPILQRQQGSLQYYCGAKK